jgi:hypothetical protein
MQRIFGLCVLLPCIVTPLSVFAQSDIAALRQRIAELEQQNQRILHQLAELSDQLAAKPPEAASTVVEAPMVPPDAISTEGNRSRLSFYGFARVDAIFDDSRPNAAQVPTYIISEAPGTEDDGNFTLHPRLTRLGLNYNGGNIDLLGGARISARIETDFQNGGSESRAIMRYRHAWAKLDWAHSSLLLGQTWDIISPLYPTVNPDTMMWNAGNLGDRRVQIRYTYNPNSNISIAAGLGLTGAVNLQDLDANGVRDGEDAGTPHFQARAGYTSPLFDLGVSGHYANEETVTAFNGVTDFDSRSVGVDFVFRPLDRLSVKGEFWTGAGLGDVRGGIGQSINTLTGNEIDSNGGWIELGFKATADYTMSAGWTYDNPDNADLMAGGRKLNRVWYMTHQLRLAPSFLIGLDYLHWTTDYLGLPKGDDNRLDIYSVYTF